MSENESSDDRVTTRDLDRIREKITISIEPRHIVFAGFALVALLVGAFLLGLVAGRSCETVSSRPIQQEVTRPKEMVAATKAEMPKRSIRPVPLTLVVPKPRHVTEPAYLERRAPDDVRTDLALWPPVGFCDPCVQESCAWPEGCDDTSENSLVLQLQTIGQFYFARLLLLEAGFKSFCSSALSFGYAFLKALEKETMQKESLPNPTVPQDAKTFTVQVRSYRDENLAKNYEMELKSQGYTATVVPYVDAQGEIWFRVRVGRFKTLEEARAFARRLSERFGDKAIVTAMESQ